jgi:hypothetical protein
MSLTVLFEGDLEELTKMLGPQEFTVHPSHVRSLVSGCNTLYRRILECHNRASSASSFWFDSVQLMESLMDKVKDANTQASFLMSLTR